MKATFKKYDVDDSAARIDEILTTSDASFEEVKSIPSRDRLTFDNGFYVWCSALFIDIRESSKLPTKYQRPSLARIYRSYISEMVAVMSNNPNCSEVTIAGDAVWGVFDTPYQADIDSVFSTAAQLASQTRILNCRYKKKKNYDAIITGIGIDYGRALMLKAGYKGSSINEVVWMGEVVNKASNLCGFGNKSWSDKQLMVSDLFYDNLNEDNKKLLERNHTRGCYHGNVINMQMEAWWKEHCST